MCSSIYAWPHGCTDCTLVEVVLSLEYNHMRNLSRCLEIITTEKPIFAECHSRYHFCAVACTFFSPRVNSTLGKVFDKCPTKKTRVKELFAVKKFCQVSYAECHSCLHICSFYGFAEYPAKHLFPVVNDSRSSI